MYARHVDSGEKFTYPITTGSSVFLSRVCLMRRATYCGAPRDLRALDRWVRTTVPRLSF